MSNLHKFLMSLFLLGYLATMAIAIPKDCRNGEFFDSNVFTWRPCSICFTKEGEMFAWNCQHCNCSRQASTAKPSTTAVPTDGPTQISTDDKVMNTSNSNSSTPFLTGINHTKKPNGNIDNNDWELPVAITVGFLVLGVIGVTIWYCRQRNDEQHFQGCYKCRSARKPTECTGYDDEKSELAHAHRNGMESVSTSPRDSDTSIGSAAMNQDNCRKQLIQTDASMSTLSTDV